MIGLLAIFSVLIPLYFLSFLYVFIRNYINASKTGLPVYVVPIDQNHIIWMITSVPLRPLLKKYLPANLFNRITLSIYGWEHYQKLQPFNHASIPNPKQSQSTFKPNPDANGDKTFLLSGCGRLELWTANPTAAKDILSRPKDFQQFDIADLFVSVFGSNVLSTNGEVWSRHRKIVASAVTERISPIAWAESLRQTKGLLAEVCGESGGEHGETKRLFDMMKNITINVLSGAGMGVVREWTPLNQGKKGDGKDEQNQPPPGFKLAYMAAVESVNKNMTGGIILPIKLLLNWPSFLPGYENMRLLGQAKIEFPQQSKLMFAKEKQRIQEATEAGKKETRNNVMSMLIAASESNTDDDGKTAVSRKGPALTDDELVGNLYIFTAAGFDSTSNTLSYAIVLLMRYPKWQDWLFEEIDHVLANVTDLSDYQGIFPQCTRTLAFLYETLRIFPAISHEAKMIKTPQTITVEDGRQVSLPAGTTVYVNNVGIHLDPSVWRDLNADSESKVSDDAEWEDSMPGRHGASAVDIASGGGRLGDEWRFRPTRWIVKQPNEKAESNNINPLALETLYQAPRGSFVSWSMGPRVCPGQRMAQVEFTAIFLTILSQYRIEPVALKKQNGERETREQINQRLDLLMENSMSRLTLEMDVFDITPAEEDDDCDDGRRGCKVRLVRR